MQRNSICRKNFTCCEIFAGSTIHPAKFSSYAHYSSCSTTHHFSTIHLSCYFTLLPFCYNFLFLPILSLVIAFDFGSFCNFAWLGQYISSCTLIEDKFCSVIKLVGSFQFSRSFSFSLIFSPFLGCQTPSKDDNLEDEQIKPFPT